MSTTSDTIRSSLEVDGLESLTVDDVGRDKVDRYVLTTQRSTTSDDDDDVGHDKVDKVDDDDDDDDESLNVDDVGPTKVRPSLKVDTQSRPSLKVRQDKDPTAGGGGSRQRSDRHSKSTCTS